MSSRTRRSLRWLLPALVALVWLAAAGPLGMLGGQLTSEQENDSAAFLPDSAESTQVTEIQRQFVDDADAIPVIVVWEAEDGITPEIQAAVAERIPDVVAPFAERDALSGAASPPIPSEDGQALQVVVPVRGTVGGDLTAAVEEAAAAAQVDGAAAFVTGPGGLLAALSEAFEGIDGLLLLVAFAVVLVILLVVYRSPLLPLLVILTAFLALAAGGAVSYLLARADLITVNGQSQGIAGILVVGAATDYGLLLVARYREELRRHESRYHAMRVALGRSVEPILASGGTVVLGVLCLLLSDLASNRGLGPIAAVNIVFAMLAALTFLPAVLVLLGRAAFWPLLPRYGSQEQRPAGLWFRVTRLVRTRPVAVLASSVGLLLVASAFLPLLRADGVSSTEIILGDSQAVDGQAVLARHYPAGTGAPAVVITSEGNWEQVAEAVTGTDGVVDVAPVTDTPAGPPPGVTPGAAPETSAGQTGPDDGGTAPGDAPTPGGDPAASPPTGQGTPDGAVPPGTPVPKVVDGLVQLEATLADEPDSSAAVAAVRELRVNVREVDPDALVGGTTAQQVDVRAANERDQRVIIPAVLLVIGLVLAALLRSLAAPALLLLTVVLSFTSTLGIAALVFNEVFRFPGADPSLVLLSFVFLGALGIDYNIFLMTRAREESLVHGTRDGVLRALVVTGGVITSAGIVLAATFGALAVLPLLFLAQIAFVVALGVLVDAIVVRSLVVPAAVYLLGNRTWWPSRLSRMPDTPLGAPDSDPEPSGTRATAQKHPEAVDPQAAGGGAAAQVGTGHRQGVPEGTSTDGAARRASGSNQAEPPPTGTTAG